LLQPLEPQPEPRLLCEASKAASTWLKIDKSVSQRLTAFCIRYPRDSAFRLVGTAALFSMIVEWIFWTHQIKGRNI
jgi:hypothetical protein